MQANDFPRFNAVMTGMAALYQRDLSGPLLDAYWLALGDWSLADFEAAAAQLMKTAQFMPRPAEFTALRDAGKPTAGEAWGRILQYARRDYSPNGVNQIPKELQDPVIMRAVNAVGGFHAIAMSDVDSTQFLERRFAEHFTIMQDSEEIRSALPEIANTGRRRLDGPQRAGNILGRLGKDN